MTAIDLTGKQASYLVWRINAASRGQSPRPSQTLALTWRLHTRTNGCEAPSKRRSRGLGDPLLVECDATSDEQVANVYEAVKARHGSVDIVIHSVAFADRKDLGGAFSASDLQGFRTALEVSAYTLIPIVSKAVPHMGEEGGSVVAMTFDAANRVYPGYNIMGTAKAALEKRGPTNWPTSSALETSGSTPSRPDRCRRSPHAQYPVSTICAAPTPTGRRCNAT